MPSIQLLQGDCLSVLKALPQKSAQTCVTSPPYFGLRDYGVEGQVGLEETPDEYVQKLVEVFREVRRVLRDDGTLWLNLGDSYANDTKWGGSSSGKHVAALHGQTGVGRGKKHTGLKAKDLIGIPWRVAFALQADGWYLRQDIIWSKPNPMPESVRDRCTKAHEYIFLLSKSPKYYYDADAVKEPSSGVSGGGFSRKTAEAQINHGAMSLERPADDGFRNRRSVWTVTPKPYRGAHFATFPPDLIRPCILAGAPKDAVVLDPFNGSGTTGQVCIEEGRSYIGIELNPEYIKLSEERIAKAKPPVDAPTLFDGLAA